MWSAAFWSPYNCHPFAESVTDAGDLVTIEKGTEQKESKAMLSMPMMSKITAKMTTMIILKGLSKPHFCQWRLNHNNSCDCDENDGEYDCDDDNADNDDIGGVSKGAEATYELRQLNGCTAMLCML